MGKGAALSFVRALAWFDMGCARYHRPMKNVPALTKVVIGAGIALLICAGAIGVYTPTVDVNGNKVSCDSAAAYDVEHFADGLQFDFDGNGNFTGNAANTNESAQEACAGPASSKQTAMVWVAVVGGLTLATGLIMWSNTRRVPAS